MGDETWGKHGDGSLVSISIDLRQGHGDGSPVSDSIDLKQ